MLVPVTIKEWRIDGDRRVHNKTTGMYALLNHTNMFEIHSISTGSWFYFFDNIANVKDNGAYVKTTTTVANIIQYADRVAWHTTIALKVYPKDDFTETVVSTLVNFSDISYAFDHEQTSTGASWVYVREGGMNMKRYLVNNSVQEIYAYLVINTPLPA